MSYHSKRRIVNTVVYLVLALIVVSVLCVTVITFVSANRGKDRVPLPDGGEASSGAADAGLFGGEDKPSPTPPPDESSDAPTVKPDASSDAASDGDSEIPTNTEPERSYTLPVKGYIQKGFSVSYPVWSVTMEDHRAHRGIDVSAQVGEAVCAIAPGVVAEVRNDPLMGMTVTLSHEGGLTSIYANLAPDLAEGIAAGASVGEGQVLGAVGDTAITETAESDHLHFELCKDGALVDPADYLHYADAPHEDTGVE